MPLSFISKQKKAANLKCNSVGCMKDSFSQSVGDLKRIATDYWMLVCNGNDLNKYMAFRFRNFGLCKESGGNN